MRATTAFKRLIDLRGVSVTEVGFGRAQVVVTVRLDGAALWVSSRSCSGPTVKVAKTGGTDAGPGIGDLRPIRAKIRRPGEGA